MAFERDPRKIGTHDRVLQYTLVPFVPRFITPNMVTVFRFLCTPVLLWFLYHGNYAVGVPLFIALGISDALDGTLARLRNQITAWGTFYDPVADKILIGSVVLLIVVKHVSWILAGVIIGIELAIILGGIHRRRHKTTAFTGANIFGKIKMVLQVVGISLLLIAVWSGQVILIPWSVGILCIATFFAVISLFTYGL